MRRFLPLLPSSLATLALALLAYGSGCGGSKPKLGGGGGGQGGDDGGAEAGPHALGIVVLGETHGPSGGTSTPIVLASFIPDASVLASTCSSQVGGCTFVTAPQCGGSGSSCGESEVCSWDSSCNATCTAACSLQCSTGQECYFVSPNQPACRTTQTFDAGALAFAGTTTPITLFPPYEYQSTGNGSPFLAGAQIEVQASGAAAAGFDPFDHKFTATTFLQTNLASVSAATFSGTGNVPVTWTPGADDITITVAGSGGTATCPATDAAGAFQIPRTVVTAAVGSSGMSELTVSVTRARDDWDKNATTHGTLTGATVQPVGWVNVSTQSSESATFAVTVQAACAGGETMCPDGCFDLETNQYHCGSCTVVCSATESCQSGACATGTSTDCTACQDDVDVTTCLSSYDQCENDGECGDYQTCFTACAAGDTTCLGTCETEYPNGYTDYISYKNCICVTACPTQCASACAQ